MHWLQRTSHSITSSTLTWSRPPWPSHDHRCEIAWIFIVFRVLYVNQSSNCRDTPTLYNIHLDIVTTNMTKSRSPTWNRLDLSYLLRAVWLYVNQSLLIAEILYINHIDMVTTTTTKSHGLRCETVWIYFIFCVQRSVCKSDRQVNLQFKTLGQISR